MNEKNTQTVNGEGAALGLVGGLATAGCLLPVGIILCFTGIGAIIGIPMIIAAIISIFLSPLVGIGTLKGECPWCESTVRNIGGAKGFNCPICKNRVVVKDKKFIKIN